MADLIQLMDLREAAGVVQQIISRCLALAGADGPSREVPDRIILGTAGNR